MIDSLDAYGKALGLFVLIYGKLMYSSPVDYAAQPWYRATKEKVGGVPRGWVFGVVWFLLYGALFTAHTLFLVVYEAAQSTGTYAAYFSLALVNVFLLHIWDNLFFRKGQFFKWLGFVDTLLILASVVGLIIVAALEHRWVVWLLHIPLGLWVMYASYLSLMFALRYKRG